MKQRSDVILNPESNPSGVCGVTRTHVSDKLQGGVFELNCSLWKERAAQSAYFSGNWKYTRWGLSMSWGLGGLQERVSFSFFKYLLLKDHLIQGANCRHTQRWFWALAYSSWMWSGRAWATERRQESKMRMVKWNILAEEEWFRKICIPAMFNLLLLNLSSLKHRVVSLSLGNKPRH